MRVITAQTLSFLNLVNAAPLVFYIADVVCKMVSVGDRGYIHFNTISENLKTERHGCAASESKCYKHRKKLENNIFSFIKVLKKNLEWQSDTKGVWRGPQHFLCTYAKKEKKRKF